MGIEHATPAATLVDIEETGRHVNALSSAARVRAYFSTRSNNPNISDQPRSAAASS